MVHYDKGTEFQGWFTWYLISLVKTMSHILKARLYAKGLMNASTPIF